jgi:hypothetical protein
MLTNLRLADLRLTTAQQRSTGQNLPASKVMERLHAWILVIMGRRTCIWALDWVRGLHHYPPPSLDLNSNDFHVLSCTRETLFMIARWARARASYQAVDAYTRISDRVSLRRVTPFVVKRARMCVLKFDIFSFCYSSGRFGYLKEWSAINVLVESR